MAAINAGLGMGNFPRVVHDGLAANVLAGAKEVLKDAYGNEVSPSFGKEDKFGSMRDSYELKFDGAKSYLSARPHEPLISGWTRAMIFVAIVWAILFYLLRFATLYLYAYIRNSWQNAALHRIPDRADVQNVTHPPHLPHHSHQRIGQPQMFRGAHHNSNQNLPQRHHPYTGPQPARFKFTDPSSSLQASHSNPNRQHPGAPSLQPIPPNDSVGFMPASAAQVMEYYRQQFQHLQQQQHLQEQQQQQQRQEHPRNVHSPSLEPPNSTSGTTDGSQSSDSYPCINEPLQNEPNQIETKKAGQEPTENGVQ